MGDPRAGDGHRGGLFPSARWHGITPSQTLIGERDRKRGDHIKHRW